MSNSPFIDNPREVMRQLIAVASPIEEVRAIHIRAAEHQADLARDCRLVMQPRAGVLKEAIGQFLELPIVSFAGMSRLAAPCSRP